MGLFWGGFSTLLFGDLGNGDISCIQKSSDMNSFFRDLKIWEATPIRKQVS